MSGGVAYVWDIDSKFKQRVNTDNGKVLIESLTDREDIDTLLALIESHYAYTHSARSREILDAWETTLPQFVKIISSEYKEMIKKLAEVAPHG
jgi:glutamate synthase domain-containing protein 3